MQYSGKTIDPPAGFTLELLVQEAFVPRNFVSLIELGQSQPSIATIAKLARALGVSASELVAEAGRASLLTRAKVKN